MTAAQTMDFAFNEVQAAVAEAAEAIFAANRGVGSAPAGRDWFDVQAWSQLAGSGLLGVLVPAEYGGSGYGLLEACVLLQAQGRYLIRVPLLESALMAGAMLGAFASQEQKEELLPQLVDGATLIVPAMAEHLNFGVEAVSCTATASGGGWILDGVKTCVPLADRAARLLVPALLDSETPAVFVIDPTDAGVTLAPGQSTTGRPEFEVMLQGVWCAGTDILGGLEEAEACARMLGQYHAVGTGALQLGVLEHALQLTARYTTEREQFGHPLATFQGVALRAADAYIDIANLRTSLWFAAWRLAQGHDATDDLDIALVWASEGGSRVMWTAQHLHGGIGVDKNYALAQYITWSKANELAVGGSMQRIAAIGARMAGHL